MPEDLYEIIQTPRGAILDLRIGAEADSEVFDSLNDALMAAVKSRPGGSWVVDLGAVAYFRSAMLGLLVNLHTQIQGAGGALILCALPKRLMEIIQTCCLERLFTMTKTREQALDALPEAGK